MSKKISYLGVPGSYSHQACMERFPDSHYLGFKKFREVLNAADRGDADFAMIPVENSSVGRVTEVYNLLPSVDLHIIGEYLLPIHHCLVVPYKSYRGELPSDMSSAEAVAWKGSPLSEEEKQDARASIQEVRSHPQGFLQCSGYLDSHLPKAISIVDFDTATAAKNIAPCRDASVAAISSRHAADIYNLLAIDEEIENDTNNMTRFLILRQKPLSERELDGPCLTSILFQTNHKPGSLLKALQAFADHDVNMTKLETYMLSQELPYPTFYVDVGESIHSENMQLALKVFDVYTTEYNVLGCYSASPHRGKKNSFLPVF